ncbi:lysozyme inhibitor LprI family protein [Pseudophaeobacter sp.]|uniref:lysozyme inhibitor LprI family protein n=1 Tax=Pseudophaeobacter sp. TaxID=1971739 RepID=UPI003296848E
MPNASFVALLTGLTLALLPNLASADCSDPQTTHAMRSCAAQDYERADAALNAAYKAAQRSMKQLDQDLPDDLKGASKALLQAQRAWISYRDAACAAEGFQFRGGSFEPLMILICKTELTEQRSDQLLQLIEPN